MQPGRKLIFQEESESKHTKQTSAEQIPCKKERVVVVAAELMKGKEIKTQ